MDSDLDLHLDEVPIQSHHESSQQRRKSWLATLQETSIKESSKNYWNILYYLLFISLAIISCLGPSQTQYDINILKVDDSLPTSTAPRQAVVQECPVLIPEIAKACEPNVEDIERFNFQQKFLQDLQHNITELYVVIENQRQEISNAAIKSNNLLSELSAAKAYQQRLETTIDSYRNLSNIVVELHSKWMEHSPAIAAVDEHFFGLLDSMTLVNTTIATAKQLQFQNQVLNVKLAQSLSHVTGLHSSYSSHLSYMESQLKHVSRSCDESRIDAQISRLLTDLLASQSNFPRTTDRPVASNKSLPWVDYASARLGGQVITTMTSPTYFPIDMHLHTFKYLSALNIPVYSLVPALYRVYDFLGVDIGVGKPNDAISEDMTIGSCWPLQGSNGIITVKLKNPIYITSITIDHIPKSHAIDYRSAPEKFRVIAASSVSGPYKPLLSGLFSMQDGASKTQTFLVDANVIEEPLQYVSLNILSNHGHPEYTCLYRFRVHGNPSL